MGKLLQYLSEKYAIENIEEVNRRLLELSSLFEISQTLNRSLNLKHILDNVLLIPMGRMMISRGLILLKEGEHLVIANKKGRLEAVPDRIPCPSQSVEQITEHPELVQLSKTVELPLTLPLQSAQELTGVLMLGQKLNREPFTEEELNFLESLASIAATSIQNARRLHQLETMNIALQEKVKQLATVLAVSQEFLTTLNEEEILRRLVDALKHHLNIQQYAVYEAHGDSFVLRSELSSAVPVNTLPARITQALPTVEFLRPRTELEERLLQGGFRIAIPLRYQQEIRAYIFIGLPENKSNYQGTDLYFFQTLANQAIIALHNARLFQESLEKERLEREVSLAREIQMNLLPATMPAIPGYQIAGINLPSRTVGGDYYDVIPLENQKLAVAIGDVTGKGVPAAMLMANLQAALHLLIREDIPLPHILEKLNTLFYANTPSDKFVTLFVGILSLPDRAFTYVNAGHNYPILVEADGTIRELVTGGLLVGAFPGATYRSETITLQPGSLLFCYTDGITELSNSTGEEFGEENLYQFVKTHRNEPVPELIARLQEHLLRFSGTDVFDDDVTLLALKVE